jgi:hypothetical protein
MAFKKGDPAAASSYVDFVKGVKTGTTSFTLTLEWDSEEDAYSEEYEFYNRNAEADYTMVVTVTDQESLGSLNIDPRFIIEDFNGNKLLEWSAGSIVGGFTTDGFVENVNNWPTAYRKIEGGIGVNYKLEFKIKIPVTPGNPYIYYGYYPDLFIVAGSWKYEVEKYQGQTDTQPYWKMMKWTEDFKELVELDGVSQSGNSKPRNGVNYDFAREGRLGGEPVIGNGYIYFDGNGADSGTMEKLTIANYGSAALTANAFSRTGYTFEGWAIRPDADVSEVAYDDGDTYHMRFLHDRTLYAVWTEVI